ncbi:MAG: NAD(P)/FAD-dependent oxidoreductase [Woeseia sp.]
MSEDFDVIVIGAGHNGLTAAGYLGKAGLKTLVLERREIVGGAAVTEEFHPGYRNSIASYVVSLLRSEVVRDLELGQHGYEFIPLKGSLELCRDDSLYLNGEETNDRTEVARFSECDYDAMVRFEAMLREVGAVLRNQWLRDPPSLLLEISDLPGLLRAGRDIHNLSAEMRYRLLQMFTSSAADVINRWFESPMIRSMYASHCVSGNFASLYQAGSAIPFFHHTLGESGGDLTGWGLAKGGMGQITQAMASFARSQGVDIRTGANVEEILIHDACVTGVRLTTGESLRARAVLSNADPKRTFLTLIDAVHLDNEFVQDIRHLRMGHASLRMNLALNGLPELRDYPGSEIRPQHQSSIVIFPPLEEMEQNYHSARAGKLPSEPRLDIVIPSTLDDSLAPPDHHVMAILCKYYPYELADGGNWDHLKEQVADDIINYLVQFMPNIKSLVVGRQVLTPIDLERVFALTEGDIFHGRHDLDQIFSLRPHPSASKYQTPVKGLYLCGSGSHPGGAVSGAPGHNGAMRVIKDLR